MEALAGLADPERRLAARCVHDVEVVHENSLRRLGPQEVLGAGVLDRSDHGAQQTVEVPRLGELPTIPAVRADDISQSVLGGTTVFLFVRLDQLVGARQRLWHCLHSVSGSTKRMWPTPPTPAGPG